ncbi:ADP-ribosylglycohydrolase family protein [Dawidia soli]|uniref:ADP-ribosylglycohydrolase family protein n=1 Tax=Dawidia soli TaxID=2782352 RepID=A0AAP2D800_9BACT|nr:ADP-ribosylglycohydrolase family protein [Dawidia soli]MBT1687153.1 ADP-ribosylglycohydrolase family protein [Dawidia soli]
MDLREKAVAALLGVAVGDALGVPYEFLSRAEMDATPARDMRGYGTHHQPAGTWSDDSSLTFCLAESLAHGYDLADMARRVVQWKTEAYWTAHGNVFDIGMRTREAIATLEVILDRGDMTELELLRYGASEEDNGNGSLMRILPLLFHIRGLDIRQQFEITWRVSALTHGHIRSGMCCLIYLRLAEYLLQGLSKEESYQRMRGDVVALWKEMDFDAGEQRHFERMIQQDIREVSKNTIHGNGYVIKSLEASLWCFLATDNFESAVLSAVNLGYDTDTTGAITGGLAGVYYGSAAIPSYWLAVLARLEDIRELGMALGDKYSK